MADKGERIVVVGTGGAGLRAAERVRELDFAGELVIIGEEPYRPYHRPLLSKQVLTGSIRPRDALLPTHSDLGAVWRPKTRVSRLDPEEHVVHLPGGEEIDYDGLVIATGMQPAHLPGSPRHDPRVHVLRNIADAVAVQKLLASGKGRVALIGGGFLAGEVASAARELGRDTTIIIREPAMLDRVPGFDVSETVTALQEANGVRLVTGATVTNWHTDSADGVTMHLSTGEVVVADCVVLCVGGVPATDWLRGSGLLIEDGVLCGPTTHALGVEDIVAAGDVARWPNMRFDTVPRRVEHWMNAVEMGRAAAEALLVGRAAAAPFTPLPKFWSEQHGVRIQGAGIPTLAQDTVELTEAVPIGSKITGYVAGGSLIGILAWDSPRGMLHYTHELNRQTAEGMRRRLAEAPQQAPKQPAPQTQEARPQRPPARPLPPPRPEHTPAPMPALAPTGARQAPVRPPLPRPAMADQPSIPSMPPVNPSLRSTPAMPAVDPSVPPPQVSGPVGHPAERSIPVMPPVNPSLRSTPAMPPVDPAELTSSMPPVDSRPTSSMPPVNPAQRSNPGMPPVNPAMQSNPGMPPVNPAARSNPGMPPAERSNPGMPPAGRPAERSNPGMPAAQQSSPGMPPAARRTKPIGPPPVNPAQYKPPMSESADGTDPAIMELPPIDGWRRAS